MSECVDVFVDVCVCVWVDECDECEYDVDEFVMFMSMCDDKCVESV